MKRRLMLLMASILIFSGNLLAQNRKVTGTVTSEVDGYPIIGAYVTIQGITSEGVITDLDGKFELSNAPELFEATAVLPFTGPGTKSLKSLPETFTQIALLEFILSLARSLIPLTTTVPSSDDAKTTLPPGHIQKL